MRLRRITTTIIQLRPRDVDIRNGFDRNLDALYCSSKPLARQFSNR
jgi:hypothetical protein